VPFVGGGIYVPYPVYMEGGAPTEPAVESSPAETEQPVQEAAANPVETPVRPYANSRAPAEPDSQYVFVRQDGTVFFAVAFTFDSANLRYITRDGFRKTAPWRALTLRHATVQRTARVVSAPSFLTVIFGKSQLWPGLRQPLRRVAA